MALELGELSGRQGSKGMEHGLGWSRGDSGAQATRRGNRKEEWKQMWPLYYFADSGDMKSKLFPFLRIVGEERGSEETVKDICMNLLGIGGQWNNCSTT